MKSSRNSTDNSFSLTVKDEQETIKNLTIALEIFGCLIEDVESFGCSKAVLSLSPSELSYTFENLEGKTVSGSIHQSAREILKSFTELAVHSLGFRIHLPEKESYRILRITQPELSYNFLLSWHDESTVRDLSVCRLNIAQNDLVEKVKIHNPNIIKKVSKSKKESLSKTILVIEDNSVFANVLARFLKRHEISCSFSQSAAEALEILANGSLKPDLIICDMHMPTMSGVEFLSKLRCDAELGDIPLIMLTGDESIETKIQAISSGAEAYLTKSEDPRILCAHVTRLLKQVKRKEAA